MTIAESAKNAPPIYVKHVMLLYNALNVFRTKMGYKEQLQVVIVQADTIKIILKMKIVYK